MIAAVYFLYLVAGAWRAASWLKPRPEDSPELQKMHERFRAYNTAQKIFTSVLVMHVAQVLDLIELAEDCRVYLVVTRDLRRLKRKMKKSGADPGIIRQLDEVRSEFTKTLFKP